MSPALVSLSTTLLKLGDKFARNVNIGLRNIENNVFISGDVAIVVGKHVPEQGTAERSAAAIVDLRQMNREQREQPPSLPAKDVADLPEPADEHPEDLKPIVLPVEFGLYVRFQDPRWWMDLRKEFIDVAEAFRVISLGASTVEVPPFHDDSGTQRLSIELKGRTLTVRGNGTWAGSPKFTSSPQSGSHPRLNYRDRWFLSPIPMDEVHDLHLRRRAAMIYCSTAVADRAWSLVHCHRDRGDEVYILIPRKGE